MDAKLLCIGDVHLGRRPSRLPEGLRDVGLAPEELGPAAAWRRCVAKAIELRVDAVVFVGDVVESDSARFEAWAPLREGVLRLAEHGIEVVGVAGNHDVDALPRLAAQESGFRLLGEGGSWESWTLEKEGKPCVRLLGWSFGQRYVEESPIDSLQYANDHRAPVIGLLHCDLDASGSRHAPVARHELEAVAIDAWLLGHIHVPTLARADSLDARPIGYLGSLVGLDPSEQGVHGPWLLEIEDSAIARIQQLPLAPLRWEVIDVSAEEVDEIGIEAALADAFAELEASRLGGGASLDDSRADAAKFDEGARAAAHGDGPLAVGCRVRIQGASRDLGALERDLQPLLEQGVVLGLPERCYFVERVLIDARPARDLEALARGDDPVAMLAALILELERSDASEVVALAREDLQRILQVPAFRGIADEPPGEVRELLLRAGRAALEELLA